jgi:putative ABC transport system permease protein
MTRATERQQEMAVRAALGAGRARLVRQQLAESVILSGVGGALGVLLAWWGLRSLIASAPDIPRLEAVSMDASVVGFALLATFATALLFGLAPALHTAGADVAGWLKERATSGRRGAQRIRGALVVAQVALSLVLLIGAGLLVRSLVNRIGVGVGFNVDQLLTGDIALPNNPYDTPERQSLFFEQLVDRVKTIPGVTDASAIIFPPLTGPASATNFWLLDRPIPEAGQLPSADIRWVHRDYHKVMGIPLIAGRYFEERDRGDAPLAILVNETGAKQLWPGEDPIGKRLAMPWGDTLLAEVVGVVGDVRHEGPDTELRSMLYWEHRQFRAFPQMSLIVRTESASADMLPALRAALRDQDPTLPLFNVRSMEELFATALARARFTAASLGLFALLALILAAIGIYAVMAYATEQRSQEIGIRIALGANRASVVRMVVGQGLAQIAVALVIGTMGALALSRLLRSLMFEVTTTDPLTFGAMALLLALTALVACWLPARRASGIDPVAAIRHE